MAHCGSPGGARGAGSASQIDECRNAGAGASQILRDVVDEQEMQRTVEKSERRALAGARERRAFGELGTPLDIGRRQRAQRARQLGERELREMSRAELVDPAAERVVYGQDDAIILTDFTPRA